MPDIDNLQENYDDLINAVFERAYDDLVEAYKKRKEAIVRLKQSVTYKQREAAEFDIRCAEKKIEWYVDWLKHVLPRWRDIDPQRIIDRAKEVGNEID